MIRKSLLAAAMLALLLGVTLAADPEGTKATVTKVDTENSQLVLTVAGEEKTYDVSKDAEIYTQAKGKKNKPGPKDPVTGGLSGIKADSEILFTTIKKSGKEIIVSIKLEGKKK